MIKEYFKFVSKYMKNGGFVLLGIFAFVLVPYTLFQIYKYDITSIIWFIVSTPVSASFGAFYFGQYKNKKIF